MTQTVLSNWDNGPFGAIRHVDVLDAVFRHAVSLHNFTEKELSAQLPRLSIETRNEFCNVLNCHPELASRKELNIPNASPCRYTLTDQGIAAIEAAGPHLAKALRSQKTTELRWDRPKPSVFRTLSH